jgi:hypothetical protein
MLVLMPVVFTFLRLGWACAEHPRVSSVDERCGGGRAGRTVPHDGFVVGAPAAYLSMGLGRAWAEVA